MRKAVKSRIAKLRESAVKATNKSKIEPKAAAIAQKLIRKNSELFRRLA